MNQLLQKAQAAILQKADPRMVPVIQKIVDAGKKVMYSQQTRKMFFDEIKQGADPEVLGTAVAKLMGILYNQSKKSIPPEAMVKAAAILLCEGLQFLEDAGMVKVDANFLAACTKAMTSALLQLLGATPEQVGSLMKGQQPTQPAGAQPSAAPAAPAQPTGIIQGAQ